MSEITNRSPSRRQVTNTSRCSPGGVNVVAVFATQAASPDIEILRARDVALHAEGDDGS
jgi:hypothetical protein